MTCEWVKTPNGDTIMCGRGGRSRIVCDVCDKTVGRNHPTANMKGQQIDLCVACERRIRADDEFRVWASKQALSHYEGKPDATH